MGWYFILQAADVIILRTSLRGCTRFAELTLSVSSFEIFLVAGFSRTMFKLEPFEKAFDKDGAVNAPADAITDDTANI
jgi:hypothetical protein